MKKSYPNKIYIIGGIGSGKTTLAKKLSKILKLPHYDLDEIYWKRKYDARKSDMDCKKELNEITKENGWIIEGIYTVWVKPAVNKSQLIIWLDYSFSSLVLRLIKRWLTRNNNKSKESWHGYWRMIKQNYQYTHNKKTNSINKNIWGYKLRERHKDLLKNCNAKIIIIKNQEDLDNLVNSLK